MRLYMRVTRDKYELPLCVTNNIYELSDKYGVKVEYIRQQICRSRKSGKRAIWQMVEVSDEEDED